MLRPEATTRADRLLLFAMAVVFALVAAHVAWVRPMTPALVDAVTGAPQPAGGDGEIRDVDVERIRRLILEGRLSDREADHYRPLGPSDAGTPASEGQR